MNFNFTWWKMIDKSVVSDYFNGKSVFITGATGFIGKVILKIIDVSS